MNCDSATLLRNARCFRCLPRSEISAAKIYLLCQWANHSSTGCLHATVEDWANRVIANKGGAPSQTSKDALCVFMEALDAAGITSKMISVNCVVPDNLIAATTPLIANSGNDPWTNTNFVAGDLTVNGLLGAANKHLDTGVVPTTALLSDTEGGLSFYNLTVSNGTYQEMGALSNAGSRMMLAGSWGGTCFWDCWDTTTGRLSPANPLWAGFVSGSRTAANDYRVYRASSSNPFQQLDSSALTGGTRPTHSIFAFAYNNAGSPAANAVKRLSFIAVHHGLTPNETESLFNAVQAMRTALGGGFV